MSEKQITDLTNRISNISNHLKSNHKDHSTQRGLMRLVGQRKSLLGYLQKNNLIGYRELIKELELRK
jgi:small subunit ribosomal protein S15